VVSLVVVLLDLLPQMSKTIVLGRKNWREAAASESLSRGETDLGRIRSETASLSVLQRFEPQASKERVALATKQAGFIVGTLASFGQA
jgi:hypothetical protein